MAAVDSEGIRLRERAAVAVDGGVDGTERSLCCVRLTGWVLGARHALELWTVSLADGSAVVVGALAAGVE
ncbi:hypothetical protein GCM10025857_15690 [Alicyclobacillus contaminans]|nr:hypothetical protein GCM10025857_15690 [Alicyclobacillus contaminans]